MLALHEQCSSALQLLFGSDKNTFLLYDAVSHMYDCKEQGMGKTEVNDRFENERKTGENDETMYGIRSAAEEVRVAHRSRSGNLKKSGEKEQIAKQMQKLKERKNNSKSRALSNATTT